MKFDHPTQPFLSAVMDWDLGDIDVARGLIIRTQFDYKPMHFHASGYANLDRFDKYEIKAHTIEPVISILYRVPWRWKLQPYAGIGAGMMWSTVTKNTLTIHYDKPYYGTDTETWDHYLDLDEDNYVLAYTAGFFLLRDVI